MTDVDQSEFQAKYHRYLSTQQRVSDWVRGTSSQSQSSRKTSASRHISKPLATRGSRSSARRSKGAGLAISTTIARQRAGLLDSEPQTISPTIALITSALFVCVLLPSLLTISAFVLLLTYAGSLEARHSRGERKAERRS